MFVSEASSVKKVNQISRDRFSSLWQIGYIYIYLTASERKREGEEEGESDSWGGT